MEVMKDEKIQENQKSESKLNETNEKTKKLENDEKPRIERTAAQKLCTFIGHISKAALFWLWVDIVATLGNDMLSNSESVSPSVLRTLDPTLCHLDQNSAWLYKRWRMRNAWSRNQRLILCVYVSWDEIHTSANTLAWNWDELGNERRQQHSCDDWKFMQRLVFSGNNESRFGFICSTLLYPRLRTRRALKPPSRQYQ